MRKFDPKLKKDTLSSDEKNNLERLKRKIKRDETLTQARIQNELARKYRDFKRYYFGKYLTKVPILRVDRYLEVPLSSSSAKPFIREQKSFGQIAIEEALCGENEVGQQLEGVMIPKIKEIPKTVAPKGQPTKDKGRIRSDVSDDSAFYFYTKIGSSLVFAGIVTIVAVPLMIKILSFVSPS